MKKYYKTPAYWYILISPFLWSITAYYFPSEKATGHTPVAMSLFALFGVVCLYHFIAKLITEETCK